MNFYAIGERILYIRICLFGKNLWKFFSPMLLSCQPVALT